MSRSFHLRGIALAFAGFCLLALPAQGQRREHHPHPTAILTRAWQALLGTLPRLSMFEASPGGASSASSPDPSGLDGDRGADLDPNGLATDGDRGASLDPNG